jgi:hypothetical protein
MRRRTGTQRRIERSRAAMTGVVLLVLIGAPRLASSQSSCGRLVPCPQQRILSTPSFSYESNKSFCTIYDSALPLGTLPDYLGQQLTFRSPADLRRCRLQSGYHANRNRSGLHSGGCVFPGFHFAEQGLSGYSRHSIRYVAQWKADDIYARCATHHPAWRHQNNSRQRNSGGWGQLVYDTH